MFLPKKESYKDNKQLTFSIVLESFLATLEFEGLELGFELFLFPLLSNIAGLSPKSGVFQIFNTGSKNFAFIPNSYM